MAGRALTFVSDIRSVCNPYKKLYHRRIFAYALKGAKKMYESPIELIKALKSDRDQYEKGYNDGYKDGQTEDNASCSNSNKNVIYASPEVYERIVNNPKGVVIVAQGEPSILIKRIG
jgi:hypothetical protein